MVLQKRVAELENENTDFRQKLNMGPAPTTNKDSMMMMTKAADNEVDLLICPPVPPRESANVANQIFACVHMYTYFWLDSKF